MHSDFAFGDTSYSTATLIKNCECEDSYFTFADMEGNSQQVKFSKGKVLGKYCEIRNTSY